MREPLIASRPARRSSGAVLCLLFVLAAGPAAAVSNKAECRRLTRQIDHFEDVAQMAADRRDELWLNGTLEHIDRLAGRRVELCPEYAEPDYAAIYAKWFADLVKKAGKAFLSYMTFGAYPGL